MTIQDIKEELSIRLIECIANFNGFDTVIPKKDYGTDICIKEQGTRIENGRNRYFDTGRELKIQAKSTTIKSITENNTFISYNLESKTYNDLITRKNDNKPLILIVVILPENQPEWLEVDENNLILRKSAYWYVPEDDNLTNNTSSITIRIKKQNLLTKESFVELFENQCS